MKVALVHTEFSNVLVGSSATFTGILGPWLHVCATGGGSDLAPSNVTVRFLAVPSAQENPDNKSQDLEIQGCPASNGSSQGTEQVNENGSFRTFVVFSPTSLYTRHCWFEPCPPPPQQLEWTQKDLP